MRIKLMTGIQSYRVLETFLVFLRLGMTSFGGPIAHLGFFQQECVQRRKWLTDSAYADLVALCQFLPGPASSQVGFALGYIRAGVLGAFAAWVAFTLPSAVIMIACAYGLRLFVPGDGWTRGLMVAAVAVVAQSVWIMAERLCPDRTRITMAIVAACVVLGFGSAWSPIAVILAGMGVGWLCFRKSNMHPIPEHPAEEFGRIRHGAFATSNLSIFFALLIALPLVSAWGHNEWLVLADRFYRTGAVVFGGGHVVLPLLEADTVGRGLITQDTFLVGYGMAQALPGPLFSFAAYLGAVTMPNGPGWAAGLWCLAMILLPSFLLVLGVLPFWHQLRKNVSIRAIFAGANATVVGILLAALYDPVGTTAINSSNAVIVALAAFGALQIWKLPPWLIVILCAASGVVFL